MAAVVPARVISDSGFQLLAIAEADDKVFRFWLRCIDVHAKQRIIHTLFYIGDEGTTDDRQLWSHHAVPPVGRLDRHAGRHEQTYESPSTSRTASTRKGERPHTRAHPPAVCVTNPIPVTSRLA